MWKRMLLLASTLAVGAMTMVGCASRGYYGNNYYGRSSARVRVYSVAPSRGRVYVEEYRAPYYRNYRYRDYRWR